MYNTTTTNASPLPAAYENYRTIEDILATITVPVLPVTPRRTLADITNARSINNREKTTVADNNSHGPDGHYSRKLPPGLGCADIRAFRLTDLQIPGTSQSCLVGYL